MVKRGLRASIVAAAVAIAVAACGSADAQYVKNSKAGIFVKVPKAWGVFTLRNGHPMELGAKKVTNGGEAIAENQTPWLVGFDGAAAPNRANFESADLPADPIGLVQVLPLTDSTVPRTLAGLRSLFTTDGSDPVAKPAAGFEVKDYAELEFPSGHWGIRMTFKRSASTSTSSSSSASSDASTASLLVEAIAAFDPSVERVYIVEAQCTETCFDNHRSQIDHVLDSVTLEKR